MTSSLKESGTRAQLRAGWCGVPDPEHVRRCVVGGDQDRTTFYYDDGRDPWVLPGMREVEQ